MDGIDFMGLGRIGALFYEHNTAMAIANSPFLSFQNAPTTYNYTSPAPLRLYLVRLYHFGEDFLLFFFFKFMYFVWLMKLPCVVRYLLSDVWVASRRCSLLR